MPRDNNSLVLEICRENTALKMSIFQQQDISSTIRHYSRLSFSPEEINKLCVEITAILNKADKRGILDAESIVSLKKTGQLLWDHLLTKTVKDKLRSSAETTLSISLDEELISVPWELLYDGNEFLCLKFSLGRLVRTREQISRTQYRDSGSRLKMLILANPTDDLKSAYREGLQIRNQFERKRKEMSIDFKGMRADTIYVKKNLRDYDVVHFAGHCEYDTVDTGKSGWVLSDGKFTIEDIFALGETLPLPGLIFSNACYSAKAADSLMEADYQAKAYSLASAFLFSGVRHYIGTIRRIEDTLSEALAREFYARLLGGSAVGECLRKARLKLIKEHGLGAISWASYLLYGDTNFVMLQRLHKPLKLRSAKARAAYKKIILRSVLAVALFTLGLWLYFWLPTINPSTHFLFRRSARLFRSGDNLKAMAVLESIIKKDAGFLAAYPMLAETYQRQGKRQEALKYYFDYALMSEKKNDMRNLASSYINIGWVYQLTGQYPKANEFYHKAIKTAEENNDMLNLAIGLRKLAVWNIDKENPDAALELLTKSSEINRSRENFSGHRYNLACDYFDIGLVFADRDDFTAAGEFYRKSQDIFERLKLKDELSDCHFNRGEIFLFEKEYLKALSCYKKGLEIDQAQDNRPSIASDYQMLGELYFEMGNIPEAEKYFCRSIDLAAQIEAPLELASASYSLGLLYQGKGHFNKAREYLRQAQEIYSRVDTPDYKNIKQIFLSLSNPS